MASINYNQNQMSKASFYEILDARNISAIKRIESDEEMTYAKVDARNKTLPTIEAFEVSAKVGGILADISKKTSNDLTTAIISDIGCGIGNGAEMIARVLKASDELKYLEDFQLRGLEKQKGFAEEAERIFAAITDNSYVIQDDVMNGRRNVIGDLLSIDDLGDQEVSIVYCGKVLEDREYQEMLEEEIITKAPVSTIFVFPHKLKGKYVGGLKPFTSQIFQKVSNDIKRV